MDLVFDRTRVGGGRRDFVPRRGDAREDRTPVSPCPSPVWAGSSESRSLPAPTVHCTESKISQDFMIPFYFFLLLFF